jgi:L-lactate utilization protein LutB
MQTERCSFIKADGRQCGGAATGSQGRCWSHAVENAEQRRRQASRAARSKGNKEVSALKAEIKQLIADVKAKNLDRNDAAVVIQAYRALKDFIELERRVKETDELAAELAELKEELRHEQAS